MKRSHLTVVGLLTLVLLITSMRIHEDGKSHAATNEAALAASTEATAENANTTNKAWIFQALSDISLYSWWNRYSVPRHMIYHKGDRKITFEPMYVTDQLAIQAFDLAAGQHEKLRIPVYSELRPTRSIVVSLADIVGALQLDTSDLGNFNPEGYKGIRVYEGLRVDAMHHSDSNYLHKIAHWLTNHDKATEHLFVVPVTQRNGRYQDHIPHDPDSTCFRSQYAYDLTTPCPNSCDEASVLDLVWHFTPSGYESYIRSLRTNDSLTCDE